MEKTQTTGSYHGGLNDLKQTGRQTQQTNLEFGNQV